MNQSIIKEIEYLKKRMPSKNQYTSALFSILHSDDGYQVEETVSNDFAHLPEAIMRDEKYFVSETVSCFETVEEAVTFIGKRRADYHGMMPCLLILGVFTAAEMNEIRKLKKILLLNDKYFEFLYGIVVHDEYRTRIVD